MSACLPDAQMSLMRQLWLAWQPAQKGKHYHALGKRGSMRLPELSTCSCQECMHHPCLLQCNASCNAQVQAKQCIKHTLCSAILITTHGKTQGSCRHGASTRNPQVATAANPTLLFLVGGLLRRTMIFGCFAGPSRASSAMLPCKAPEKTVLRPVCYALLCSQSNTCNQCRTQSQHEL